MPLAAHWFTARQIAEAIQMPRACFRDELLRDTEPAIDRLGMPIVTSGQFAFVFKLNLPNRAGAFAVRAFRSYSADRARRYQLIDAHLRAHPVAALGGFDYDAEGIIIEGRAFPILVMPWIEGHTLDVYLSEVFKRESRDNNLDAKGENVAGVIQNLIDEWLRVISDLRAAHIAHGDLQHGNIIIEGSRLRLVDFDGMFVPAMRAFNACEVGHQHFQHPHRTPQFFDSTLDRFSSLVIYVSLLALRENPALWARYHDENLLFTKGDFVAPDASRLFDEIKSLGGEAHRFAALLADAARRAQPEDAPDWLTLIEPPTKPKLPIWMRADAVDFAVKARTREASEIDLPAQVIVREAEPTRPLAAMPDAQRLPVTPSSIGVQTIFGGMTQTAASGTTTITNDPYPAPLDPQQFLPASWYYAKQSFYQGAGFAILFGFQAIWRVLAHFTGLPFPVVMVLSLLLFAAAFFLVGMSRAYRKLASDQRNLNTLNSQLNPLAHLTAFHQRTQLPPPSTTAASSSSFSASLFGSSLDADLSVAPAAINASSHGGNLASPTIIASRTQGIYHLESCEWARRIAPRNRIGFPSSRDAQAAGFRDCKVCQP